MQPCGLLVLNKPPGISSFAALRAVKRLAKPAKVGHAGTLDPIADGVLVACVGSATRLIRYVQQMPKQYRATFRLGCESPTDDVEGEIVELPGAPRPTVDELRQALAPFIGDVQQLPPAYSAVKVSGRRAYALARAGEEVALKPRVVRIHACELIEYDYPHLVLDIRCGSGTYVRSIGRDLARSLGSAAVMQALTRSAIGDFDLGSAIAPEELDAENFRSRLLPPRRAIPSLATATISPEQFERLRNGRAISLADAFQVDELAALNRAGELVAIMTSVEGGAWRPKYNFAHTVLG